MTLVFICHAIAIRSLARQQGSQKCETVIIPTKKPGLLKFMSLKDLDNHIEKKLIQILNDETWCAVLRKKLEMTNAQRLEPSETIV